VTGIEGGFDSDGKNNLVKNVIHHFIYQCKYFSCFYAQMSSKFQTRRFKLMINTHNVIESVTCDFIVLKFKCSFFSYSFIKNFSEIQYIMDA